jgi:hypothetical protein
LAVGNQKKWKKGQINGQICHIEYYAKILCDPEVITIVSSKQKGLEPLMAHSKELSQHLTGAADDLEMW